MTIELHDAINGDGLFDILGKAFYALETLNTSRLTTIPTEVEDFITQFQTLAGSDLDYEATMNNVASAAQSWQGMGASLISQIRRACQNLLIEFYRTDADEPNRNLRTALTYLVAQMKADGDYVDANTVGLTLTTGADNLGDVAVCYTERRGDGRPQENLYAEVVEIEVTSDESDTTPGVMFESEDSRDVLSHEWPAGSGVKRSVAATDPAASLLSNGDFEDTTITHTPDDWVVYVGTPGTDVKVTGPEVQTVVIAGTPTGGSFVLLWQNAGDIVRSTDELAYNASGSIVQAALRTIPGLEAVTVSSTGTSPDYTHTITFHGLAGNLHQLTSVSHLTGGVPTITHGTNREGNDGAYKGRALKLQGDGVTLHELYHDLTVDEEVVYFVHFRIRADTTEESSSSSSSSQSSSSSSQSTSSSSSQSSSSSSSSQSSSSSSSQSSSSSSSQSSSSSSTSSSSSSSASSSSSSSVNSSSSSSESSSSSSSSSVESSSSSSESSSSSSESSSSESSSSESSSSSSQSSSSSSSSESSSSNSSSSSESSSSQSSSSSSSASSSSSESSSSASSESSSSSSSNSSSSSAENSSSSSRSSSSSSSSSSASSESSSSESSSSHSAQELRFQICDGIAGPLTKDEEGYDNELRLNVADISETEHDSECFSFRVQRDITQPLYFRIIAMGPIAAGTDVYIDEIAIVKGTQLYRGGPYVAVFSGVTAAVNEDEWTLTATNDRAGEFQEWFNRIFDLAGKGLLLPSSGSGSLIPDTLIS